nr:phage portal protein [Halovulum dunhuangense]
MDLHREIGGGARIRAGIEFDAAGRRVAFRVLSSRPGDPLGSLRMDPLRVPAADCLHLFKPLRAQRRRGRKARHGGDPVLAPAGGGAGLAGRAVGNPAACLGRLLRRGLGRDHREWRARADRRALDAPRDFPGADARRPRRPYSHGDKDDRHHDHPGPGRGVHHRVPL